MGKAASILRYRVTKPIREFNLEHRVAKELAKEKRPAAPRHPSTQAIIDTSVRGQSQEEKAKLKKKDDILHERLKSVYVTSEDDKPMYPATHNNPSRPLPTDKTMLEEPEFGYHEPKSIPYGKVTLRQAVEIIMRHQEDPDHWTPRELALEYKLSVELTEQMLHHFKMFVMVVPPDKEKQGVVEAMRRAPLTAPHITKQLPTVGSEATQQTQGKGENKS